MTQRTRMYKNGGSNGDTREIVLGSASVPADKSREVAKKINKILPLTYELFKSSQSMGKWLRTQGRPQALTKVDEWADRLITLFLAINVPALTGKSKEGLEAPRFKEALKKYIKKHPDLCYYVFISRAVPKTAHTELERLINISGEKFELTPDEKLSVKKDIIAGFSKIVTYGVTLIRVVVPATGIIIHLNKTVIQGVIDTISDFPKDVIEGADKIIEKIPGVSEIKDSINETFPGLTKVPRWTWSILIIGIIITTLGFGWSKISNLASRGSQA